MAGRAARHATCRDLTFRLYLDHIQFGAAAVRLSTQVKPISYVKANAAQIIDELEDGGPPIVVTKNGEAKAVVMSIYEYEKREETLAFLKIVALAEADIKAGRTMPVDEAFDRVRENLRTRYG